MCTIFHTILPLNLKPASHCSDSMVQYNKIQQDICHTAQIVASCVSACPKVTIGARMLYHRIIAV